MIAIKDREMPKNCAGCFLRVGQCSKRIYMENRPSDCSLIEVHEPHGRLIDADELKKVVASAKHMDADIYDGRLFYSDHLCVGADYDDVCKAIDETPTVIPASERGLSDSNV